MNELNKTLNSWAEGKAAALVLEQSLRPVVGTLVFPPTFAPDEKGGSSGYVIDEIDGQGVVTLDTPGAEANRLEPLFMQPPLSELVPQITIAVGNQKKNLLELGHRAADALVRTVESKAALIEDAFNHCLDGDHSLLASCAPTSLVFGAWDSRGTHAKLPRLLEARIDAYGVEKRTRAAQYFSAVDYVETGLLDRSTDTKELKTRSRAGFRDSPSGRQPGGVEVVNGGKIVRTLVVNLAGIQQLGAGKSQERGKHLRRYVLGLALSAATAPLPMFLRQGCNLVPQRLDDGALPNWRAVHFDGSETEVTLSFDTIVNYARTSLAQLFPKGCKNELWEAKKSKAQAEVKKRSKGEDEVGAVAP